MNATSISKPIMVSIIGLFVFCGCSKKPDPEPIGSTTCQFTANGTTYTWNGNWEELSYGSLIQKDSYNPTYYFSTSPGPMSGYGSIVFTISTPTLTETTYDYSPVVATTFNSSNDICFVPASINIGYGDFEIGDFLKFSISKIHNGYADGNFLGSFSAGDGSAKLNISNGVFKNVKIAQ